MHVVRNPLDQLGSFRGWRIPAWSSGYRINAILPLLRMTAHHELAHHKEDVTAGILQKRMTTRVAHERYFEAHGDGMLGRLGQRSGGLCGIASSPDAA